MDRLALMVHRHQRRRDRCTDDYEGWGDFSSQTILMRFRAIRVPLWQASKGHSRPPVTAKLAGDQAHTHAFEQFPS